jgi:predicted kinase
MPPKPTLHFFCGKAGAGKSSVAKRLALEGKGILISEDVWLARLFGDQMKTFEDYIRVSRKLKSAVGPLVVDLLSTGQSVVLDFQANTRDGRKWFRSVFEEAKAEHMLHFVDTPDELCLQRISKRNVERPEGSHQLTEDDFRHVSSFFQAPSEEEGLNVRIHAAQAE